MKRKVAVIEDCECLYECKICKHRIAKCQFMQAAFDYQCNGSIGDKQCQRHISEYKLIRCEACKKAEVK